ncbi:hypothetical protein GCM10010313_81750 [Streptomyces violarus]|nr:hypothetical protein GCM10010313_81750 [Streptomyces violarus]
MLILSRQEQAAVQSWLMLSAQSVDQAREEWDKGGIALLKCGRLFTAIRIESGLVQAAAGSDEPEKVNRFLGEALHSGPVFVDQASRRYYALVPASTPSRPEWRQRRFAGVEVLGRDSYLGVPRPECEDPAMHWSYWCVPMAAPGALCDADAVTKLVKYGRDRLTVEEVRGGN